MSGRVGRTRSAGEGEGDAPPVTRGDLVVLGLILALASVLRAIDLSAPLWYDEILTLVRSVRRPVGELVAGHFSFNNHPFYSLQAKAVLAVFGEQGWALRLPAAVFGVAGVAAVWELARMLAGPRRAHATALLLAVSYHHVWFSQNARAYTALMFWFTAASILVVRGLRRPSWPVWIGYGVVMAAAMYTHLTAATFFAAQGLVVAVTRLADARRGGGAAPPRPGPGWGMPIAAAVVGVGLTLLAYAPVLDDVLRDAAAMSGSSAVDVMVEYQSPLWTLLEVVRSFARPSAPVLVVALGALAVVGLGIVATAPRDRVVAATLLIHVPLTAGFVVAIGGRVWPRFFFADLGFVLLFAVQGVSAACAFVASRLAARRPGAPSADALFAAAVGAMLVLSLPLLARNYAAPKQDLAGALEYVGQRAAPGDPVVTVGFVSVPYAEYFETGWPVVASSEELAEFDADVGTTWLVMGFPGRTARRHPDVAERLAQRYALARRFPGTLGDGDVLVYRERPGG